MIGSGLLSRAGEYIRDHFSFSRVFVLTDDTVYGLYGEKVLKSLHDAGLLADIAVIPHGEENKNFAVLQDVLEKMALSGLQRDGAVVAVGGGVVSDLAGFAAAVYKRGVPVLNLPTTLLSAVDAAIGGKNGVDLGSIKNLAGTICQPVLVLIDTQVLKELPEELICEGAGEMLKYGVLMGGKLLDQMADGEWMDHLEECVSECVRYKARLVMEDEQDRSMRRLLNLGHTFAHAIEALSSFSIPHGRAVAMGVRMAFGAAESDPERFLAAAEKCRLKEKCPFGAEEMMRKMRSDKKREGNSTPLILPIALGCCRVVPVSDEELLAAVKRGLLV